MPFGHMMFLVDARRDFLEWETTVAPRLRPVRSRDSQRTDGRRNGCDAERPLEKVAPVKADRDDVADRLDSLSRGARDTQIEQFQALEGPGALVLSLKAGGTGLNLTNANHVVLYDRWWNPAVEDQARDRAWRIGQTKTVIAHRLVCPGTVDERVEEVVAHAQLRPQLRPFRVGRGESNG